MQNITLHVHDVKTLHKSKKSVKNAFCQDQTHHNEKDYLSVFFYQFFVYRSFFVFPERSTKQSYEVLKRSRRYIKYVVINLIV